MFIVDLESCPEFVAGDLTRLREILHPGKAQLPLSYSLAHATLAPGQTSLPHRLKSSEVYYILEGTGLMRIDDEEQEVGVGHTIYIPPHAVQSIKNLGDTDLIFLCIVDPAWRLEDEEVIE